METHTIDATNKRLGRVASEAASVLMGKNKTDFTRNKTPEIDVNVINASKIKLDEKKMDQKKYAKYSGYPGGLRYEKISNVIEKKGLKEVLRRAIDGMLPKNKLRAKMMRRLKISE